MKINKDDNVLVIAGKDKGKTGKVIMVFLESFHPFEPQVSVEGELARLQVNVVLPDVMDGIGIQRFVQGPGDEPFWWRGVLANDPPRFQFSLDNPDGVVFEFGVSPQTLDVEVGVSGDDFQRRELAPQHVEHLGVFGGRIFHLLGVGIVEVVRDLVAALGDLVGTRQGKGGPGRLTGNLFVLGPKLPQPGHPAFRLLTVGAEIEAVLATNATYTTKNERKSFQFAGGIIAISNLPLRRDPLADAIASRSVLLEHEPTDEMIAAFMRFRASQGHLDLTPKACLEVVDFVIRECRASDYRLDLRHMTKALQDYRQHKHGKALRPWQELVKSSLKQLFKSDEVVPVRRADEQAKYGEIALHVFTRYPKDKRQRDDEWRTQTNKSVDALYRHGRRLKAEGLLA